MKNLFRRNLNLWVIKMYRVYKTSVRFKAITNKKHLHKDTGIMVQYYHSVIYIQTDCNFI